MTRSTESRRRFLQATAGGAVGLSAGISCASPAGVPSDGTCAAGSLSVQSHGLLPASRRFERVRLRFRPTAALAPQTAIWLFYDIRQGAHAAQSHDPAADNYVGVEFPEGPQVDVVAELPDVPRTLDLFPSAPEFLHLIQIHLKGAVEAQRAVDFVLHRWHGPRHPIDRFHFWLVCDCHARWQFRPIGFRRYRRFVQRGSDIRVETGELLRSTVTTSVRVTGQHAAVPAERKRSTPGIFWGELHGMLFNQRPLDDYYNYARNVAKLDFCAPFWFSYNTCIEDTWQKVKDAAVRHHRPGQFVPFVGFECGTPPDGSHRCVLLRDARKVPPIFCENRPPAREPFLKRRFHPDTVFCRSPRELYEVVRRYGGVVTGHFHTRTYHEEVLAEIWQKNLVRAREEEERIYALLRGGKRMGLAGTSDTHDSMPGNPYPEPHLPTAAGVTGVWADALTTDALWEAILARRIYATSGARLLVEFTSSRRPMGAELPLDAPRRFYLRIEGSSKLQRVELLRGGRPVLHWTPEAASLELDAEDGGADPRAPAFYLVRVVQTDGHRAWSSPIWFG